MTTPRKPPRFVPTLTAVIGMPPDAVVASREAVPAGPGERHAGAPVAPEDDALGEELTQRILERVDSKLEDRISDVVAAEVQAQLDVMVPRLRSEIEGVVRRLVKDSVARERAARPAPDRG